MSGSVLGEASLEGHLVFYSEDAEEVRSLDLGSGKTTVLIGGGRWELAGLPFGSRVSLFRDGTMVLLDSSGIGSATVIDMPTELRGVLWSPDGSQMIFHHYPQLCSEMGPCPSELWIVDANGRNLRRLVGSENFISAWAPSWSPDGSRVAFMGRNSDCPETCVWAIRSDGTGLTNLTDDGTGEGVLFWSPTGDRIAFSGEHNGTSAVFVMNPDGSDVVVVSEHAEYEWPEGWSPDGSHLLYMRSDELLWYQLFVVAADGSNRVHLAPDDTRVLSAQYSPDGSWVGFTSRQDGEENIWVVRPDGTDLQQVTYDSGIYRFSWHPVSRARFGDVREDHLFVNDVNWLAATGITKGCNPPASTLYCPSDHVTRGQMAAFLNRALTLGAASQDFFVDDDTSVFEGDINRLAQSGITKGCGPVEARTFCPDRSVTRGQMAAFLVRALGLTDRGSTDFVDDNDSIFEADIEKLAAAGITKGCNPPTNDRFCPDRPVTRGQMAAFLHRALGG